MALKLETVGLAAESRGESPIHVGPGPLILLLGGMTVMLGATGPWLRFPVGDRSLDVAGNQVQMSSLVDGRLVLAAGVATVVLAALMMVWHVALARTISVLLATATLAVAGYDWYHLHRVVSGGLLGSLGGDMVGRAGVGYGLWLSTAAAAICLIGAWTAAR